MSQTASPQAPCATLHVAQVVLSVAAQRAAAVRAALDEVSDIIAGERVPRACQLAAVAQVLVARLASRPELFPDAHFPAPGPREQETLFLLGEEPNQDNALYVWRPAPGLATAVHDHSTWVVVVGIEGEEPNTFWRRTDDGSLPGGCVLERTDTRRIGPGQWCSLGPRDIHSVAIDGPRAIKHLHLYGHSLMDLPERMDFDPVAGRWKVLTEKPVVLEPLA